MLTDFERSTVSSIYALSGEKVKEIDILIDKPKRENLKTVYTVKDIAAPAKSEPETSINMNLPSFSTIEHFRDIIETNFA